MVKDFALSNQCILESMSLSLHCISRNDVSKDTNFAIISAAVEVEAALGVYVCVESLLV